MSIFRHVDFRFSNWFERMNFDLMNRCVIILRNLYLLYFQTTVENGTRHNCLDPVKSLFFQLHCAHRNERAELLNYSWLK